MYLFSSCRCGLAFTMRTETMTIELTCPYCNFSKEVPKDKIPANTKWANCPRCQRRFEIFPSGNDVTLVVPINTGVTRHQDSGEEDESIRDGSHWENRSKLGLWQAIYLTIKEVLFSPDAFFKNLSPTGGIKEPLAFGLLTGSIGAMFSAFWQFLMISGGMLSVGDLFAGQLSFGLVFIIIIILVPVATVVAMFISSGVWHLFLFLVKGAGNGFEATFRVVSYSQAVQLLAIIPFIGGWISMIWQLVIQVIGLKEIHETSYLKVIFAFLIPVVMIVLLIILGMVLLFMFLGRQDLGQLLCF